MEKWTVNSEYSIPCFPSTLLILTWRLSVLLLHSFNPCSNDASLYGKSYISMASNKNYLKRARSKSCHLLDISSIEEFIPLMSTSPSLLEISSIVSFKPFSSMLKSLLGGGDVILILSKTSKNFLESFVGLHIANYGGLVGMCGCVRVRMVERGGDERRMTWMLRMSLILIIPLYCLSSILMHSKWKKGEE